MLCYQLLVALAALFGREKVNNFDSKKKSIKTNFLNLIISILESRLNRSKKWIVLI